jgi:hypothetical protein
MIGRTPCRAFGARAARLGAIPAILLVWGGCAPIVFDERADGLGVTLEVDDVFMVTLPHSRSEAGFERFEPEVRGRAIRFLERGIDDDGAREWFRFVAAQAGEAEIYTLKVEGDDRRLVRDYSLNIKVRLREW